MARGGPRRKKNKSSEVSDEPKFAISRWHAAFLGGVCGAGVGMVLCIEWLEDMSLIAPLAGGGAVVGAVAAAVVGDRVWETISDWL